MQPRPAFVPYVRAINDRIVITRQFDGRPITQFVGQTHGIIEDDTSCVNEYAHRIDGVSADHHGFDRTDTAVSP